MILDFKKEDVNIKSFVLILQSTRKLHDLQKNFVKRRGKITLRGGRVGR